MGNGTLATLRLASLGAAIRSLCDHDMNDIDDHMIAQAGGVSPDLRLAIGAQGEKSLLIEGYGGHCVEAMLGFHPRTERVLDCMEDELPAIRHLHDAWRDRKLPSILLRTDSILDAIGCMPRTAGIIESTRNRSSPSTVGDVLPDLVDAVSDDMGLDRLAIAEDPSRIWTSPMEYALVLHCTPDRNGRRLLCRTDGGHEFTHYQSTEDADRVSRLDAGARILVAWRGRTANHPGYRHRLMCPDSARVWVRNGQARRRPDTYVDVPLGTRVVITRDTREAPAGTVGTIDGYGDGTCRVILDGSLKEISVRPECMIRKRRPRGGNRRIEVHSIL